MFKIPKSATYLRNAGSVEDIRCNLKSNFEKYTVEQLKQELKGEKKERNRKSVVTLFERAIRRKS